MGEFGEGTVIGHQIVVGPMFSNLTIHNGVDVVHFQKKMQCMGNENSGLARGSILENMVENISSNVSIQSR